MSDVGLKFSDAEIKVLKKNYEALTADEFDAFLAACKRYQLNPLANQIFARVQKATDKNPRRVTYMTQIDGYRLIADRTGAYAGNDDPVFDEEANPKKATVVVYKLVAGQRCPFASSARWSQYCPAGNQDFMWRKMPHLMLGKCAESLALRKAFPAELSGLYTEDEMQQSAEPAASDTKPPGTSNPVGAKGYVGHGEVSLLPPSENVKSGDTRAYIAAKAALNKCKNSMELDPIRQKIAESTILNQDEKDSLKFFSDTVEKRLEKAEVDQEVNA